jgi:hypothetical protein
MGHIGKTVSLNLVSGPRIPSGRHWQDLSLNKWTEDCFWVTLTKNSPRPPEWHTEANRLTNTKDEYIKASATTTFFIGLSRQSWRICNELKYHTAEAPNAINIVNEVQMARRWQQCCLLSICLMFVQCHLSSVDGVPVENRLTSLLQYSTHYCRYK